MVQVASVPEADRICAASPFPYDQYEAWLEHHKQPPDPYRHIASSTAELHPRAEWNVGGREVYDRLAVERHAAVAADILTSLGATTFVVRQAVSDAPWFAGDNGLAAGKAGELLRQVDGGPIGPDFRTWRGAFVFRQQTQLMLESFLDYPFVLTTYDLEVVSLDRPLLMHISHHLAIVYTSPETALMSDLGSLLTAAGILEYPDRR